MQLSEYLSLEGAKTLRELSDESAVSYATLKAVARGMRLKFYDKAQSLSKCTTIKGDKKQTPQVSVEELCEKE